MPAPVYATATDLADWTGTPAPANAVQVLRAAANAVREETVTWIYPADPNTGLPTDATLAATLRAATCIQAAALVALEADPTAGGTVDAAVETSAGLGSAKVALAGTEQAAAARAATIAGLCIDARRELRLARQNHVVRVVG